MFGFLQSILPPRQDYAPSSLDLSTESHLARNVFRKIQQDRQVQAASGKSRLPRSICQVQGQLGLKELPVNYTSLLVIYC
jgi:hypothetical protein